MAKGIRLRYTGPVPAMSGGPRIHLVPLLDRPFPTRNLIQGRDECPTCGIIHPVKTVHLHLEPDGTCLVSEGVFASLSRAGIAGADLQVEGETSNPPPLRLDGRSPREAINNRNRKITQWQGAPLHG